MIGHKLPWQLLLFMGFLMATRDSIAALGALFPLPLLLLYVSPSSDDDANVILHDLFDPPDRIEDEGSMSKEVMQNPA